MAEHLFSSKNNWRWIYEKGTCYRRGLRLNNHSEFRRKWQFWLPLTTDDIVVFQTQIILKPISEIKYRANARHAKNPLI